MAKLTPKQKLQIKSLYESGNTYKQIQEQAGYNSCQIVSVVKGIRNYSQASKLARKNGRYKLTEQGRKRLSESGKKACKRNKKFWTKPEQEFKNILNELGLGVQFPEYVKEVLDIKNDHNPEICFQYPIQRYVCDFVDVQKRIVFRVNGDFWHANPILYDHKNLTKIQQHNVKQDKNCHTFLTKRGWHICDTWESEIYWNAVLVKKKIRAAREQGNPPVLHTGVARIVTEVAQSDWSDKLKKLWFKEPRKKETEEIICEQCGTKFVVSKHNKRDLSRKYCGNACAHVPLRKVERPSKERLKKEITQSSWKALGRKYGVSDNTIRKWAKQWELI